MNNYIDRAECKTDEQRLLYDAMICIDHAYKEIKKLDLDVNHNGRSGMLAKYTNTSYRIREYLDDTFLNEEK